MSARYLKKVLKEQQQQEEEELQQLKLINGGDDNESSESSPNFSSSAPPIKNPFDLLNDDDDDDDDVDVDVDVDDVDLLNNNNNNNNNNNDDDQENGSESTEDTMLINNYKQETSLVKKGTVDGIASYRKSKKKKKKKNMKGTVLSTDKDEEPLEVILGTLSFDDNSSCPPPDSTKAKASNVKVSENVVKQCASSILQVDPKFLSAENELRRIFGSKVVSSFENSNQTGSSRQMRGGKRGSLNHKKTILISPSDHWPRWDGSLSMELLETRDGYRHFRYVHSSSYSQAQRVFEAAKATNDLDGIAGILGFHPYHLDSLITLAEHCTFVGEHQQSSDFIAMCLYALECAWHPMFTPLQGNCQLKFCHEANKPLFTALFIHMNNMDRRGCHRCALEVCKLLLSLDSDDRKGAMCCIDYFSLRAEQYTWLERFSEEYNSDNSLWLFPNFSYSLAVCRFYIEQNDPSEYKETAKATSAELMKQALLLHPLVLKTLVAKVPLKDQVWTNVLKHAYFKSDETGIPSLGHLSNIYVERSYLIWRLPDLQKLLKGSAKLVIETLEKNSREARDWTCVRKEAFPSEKNEYAHLLISDFSDSRPTMPPENLQNLMVDPGVRVVANPPADRVPRDVANRNLLAVLFESILPWADYGGREDEGAVGEENQHNGA